MNILLYLGVTMVITTAVWCDEDKLQKQICVIGSEIDICPGNMTCKLDGSGHPFCHIEGSPIPNSHCLTEDEYEPYMLEIQEITGHEECEPFKRLCEDGYICCRTHHGHHCFHKEEATHLKDNYQGYGDD